MSMKMRVTYSVGTDNQKVTEIIEVTNWGQSGAMTALRKMYPNRIIKLYDYHEIH